MVIYVGTAFNNSQMAVQPDSIRVSELGLSGRITLNGVELLNVGQTIAQAIAATNAQPDYYFLSISKQDNGRK